MLEEQKKRERAAAVPLIERRSSTSHALGRFSRNRVSRPTSTHAQHGNENLVNIAKAVNGRPQEALDALDEAKIPRKYLITVSLSSLFRSPAQTNLPLTLSDRLDLLHRSLDLLVLPFHLRLLFERQIQSTSMCRKVPSQTYQLHLVGNGIRLVDFRFTSLDRFYESFVLPFETETRFTRNVSSPLSLSYFLATRADSLA